MGRPHNDKEREVQLALVLLEEDNTGECRELEERNFDDRPARTVHLAGMARRRRWRGWLVAVEAASRAWSSSW